MGGTKPAAPSVGDCAVAALVNSILGALSKSREYFVLAMTSTSLSWLSYSVISGDLASTLLLGSRCPQNQKAIMSDLVPS